MSNIPIQNLPPSVSVTGNELIPANQSGVTVTITPQQIASFFAIGNSAINSVTGQLPVTSVTTSGDVTISMDAATSTTDGYLTSSDFSLFNNKASKPTGTSSQLLANDGSGGFNNVNVGSGLNYASGTLTATNSGTITSVTGTAPVSASTVSGAVTVSMAAATSLVDGYLTKENFANFNSKLSGTGTETSILSGNGTGGLTTVTPRTWLTYNYNSGSPYLANTPKTLTVTTYSSWDSSTTDMLLVTGQTTNFTIGADSKTNGVAVDGQKFIFRVTNTGASSINANLTTGVDYAFRSIGGIGMSSIAITPSATLYIGCLYNVADKRWDVVAAGVS